MWYYGLWLRLEADTKVLNLNYLLWLFWRWSLMNYLPGLVSNWDPTDYRREPLVYS
jgi:hypothetical protein